MEEVIFKFGSNVEHIPGVGNSMCEGEGSEAW